jgi:hypothetical protein
MSVPTGLSGKRRFGRSEYHVAAHAGGQVQDHIDLGVANALGHLAVERNIAARACRSRDRGHGNAQSPRRPWRHRSPLGDLLGRARHMRAAVLGGARSGDGAGDEDLAVHGQGHADCPPLSDHANDDRACSEMPSILRRNMTQNKALRRFQRSSPIRVDLLALPGSSLLTLPVHVEPLRAANRQAGRMVFDWRFVSMTAMRRDVVGDCLACVRDGLIPARAAMSSPSWPASARRK